MHASQEGTVAVELKLSKLEPTQLHAVSSMQWQGLPVICLYSTVHMPVGLVACASASHFRGARRINHLCTVHMPETSPHAPQLLWCGLPVTFTPALTISTSNSWCCVECLQDTSCQAPWCYYGTHWCDTGCEEPLVLCATGSKGQRFSSFGLFPFQYCF